MRVISLLPSATEIVHALGRGADLVGRSQECDYPPEVARLPVVMGARSHDGDRPSGDIDRRVRAALSAGESLYDLDLALLARLRPDLLLTQDLCRVCSVTDAEVEAACRAAGIAPRVLSLAPTRLEDVWESVRAIGDALGVRDRGEALARSLRARSPRTPLAPGAPRVAVLEWLDPPILSGLWTPDLVAAAGGAAIGPAPGEPAQRTTFRDLAAAAPDLVVVSPCSFPVERTRAEIARDAGIARGLGALSPRLGTWLADESFFSRPGPRLADGVALVRSLLRGAPTPAAHPLATDRARAPAART